MRMVVMKSSEWGEELWIATFDMEKAFGQVHHVELFAALMTCPVDVNIVASLRKLYCDLKTYVVLKP